MTAPQRDADEGSTDGLHSSSERYEQGGKDLCKAFQGKYRVAVAILVRLILLVHSVLAVWLVVSLTDRTWLWMLLGVNLLLVLETIFTLAKRGGRESKWICPCFVAYLAAVLPPIWLVEMDRLNRYNDALDKSNNLTSLVEVNGLTVPIRLEPEVWVSVMEQTLLFLLVLCRWLLPRGDISRHELSQLLFVFMGIASDNMELFELFDEPEVRGDRVLTYVVLGVWSLSLLQFVFVLTATKNTLKLRGVQPAITAARTRQKKKKHGVCEFMFTTEIWSLLFSVVVQDGPYAATRIYTLLTYDLLTYSIIFFICKNLLVISLVFYRLAIICVERCIDDDDDEDDDDDDDSVTQNGGGRTVPSRNKTLLSGARVEPAPVPMTLFNRNTDSF
ncbi:transmembrane protein 26-like [Littorina saxatilis]|uniref:Transmembrane protein 26 n=1 Tax=Littorina saxatilis TaxID=31220 RepID=A0AAN9GKV0_9CAEN